MSARKTLTNESPNDDFFGAWKVPKSKPGSKFFQVVESPESAKLKIGWNVQNAVNRIKPIKQFWVSKEKHLKIIKVFCSFPISCLSKNSIATFSRVIAPLFLLFIAYERSFLNDNIDFILVFVDNIVKIQWVHLLTFCLQIWGFGKGFRFTITKN